ncbi:MAG: RNA polymerase sigma factor [Chitinophagales bacterium]
MAIEKKIKKLSDKEILQHIKDTGDTKLFGELYDRYANKVYRKCISMVKNSADAQDLCHEVLCKAFLNIATFAGKSSFSTWVYAITYNQCIDFLRDKKKKQTLDYDDLPRSNFDIASDDDDAIEQKFLFEIELQRLELLLEKLSSDDKVILLMKYQDEMSIADIQNILQLSGSAVKMRLKRARDRLRKHYFKIYGNTL